MKILMYIVVVSFTMMSASCQHTKPSEKLVYDTQQQQQQQQQQDLEPVQTPSVDGLEFAYFASGCFWCVEAIYEHTIGVEDVISGYSGGSTKHPTYASTNTGRTGHAEAVQVKYNPEVITFEELIDVYFASQKPTQVNGQGSDHGSQYRSIIFYQNETQKQSIEAKKSALAKKLKKNIAAAVTPFQKFWKAEAYHQDFEKLHPNHNYIRNVSVPRLLRAKRKVPKLILLN